jgi:hypothetical protein
MFNREGEIQSQRCTYCSIQYPPQANKCGICGNEKLWAIYKSGPDKDWKERVAASLGEATPPEAVPDIAYTLPHKADVSIPLHVHSGLMWLPHEALTNEGGYINLEPGSVVFVNNRFYELQARSKRQGDMWWVEEIVTDGAFDDVTPEDIINGG